jgi:Xaa-Pro aminopeptidase
MIKYQNRKEVRAALAECLPADTHFVLKPDEGKDDSDVFYLSGIRVPGASLAVFKGGQTSDYVLFVPQSSKIAAAWSNPVPPLSDLEASIKSEMPIFDIGVMPAFVQRHKGKLVEGKPEVLRNEIARFRMVKTPEESRAMESAAHVTYLAFDKLMRESWKGLTEASLASLWELFMSKAADFDKFDDVETAFDTIVANGQHARCMHYNPRGHGSSLRNAVIKTGNHFVIDAGARINGYCCDVTRTVPAFVDKTQDGFFKALYNIVLNTQYQMTRIVKAGMTAGEIQAAMMEQFVDGLMREGALDTRTTSREALIYSEELTRLAVHGWGHFIGIDCHDPFYYPDLSKKKAPDLSNHFRYLQNETVIPEGAYITIEPGLYPDESSTILKEGYRSVGGIRTEGVFYVTSGGCQETTFQIPRDLNIIMEYRMIANLEKPKQEPAKTRRRK